jgi:tetratricopeptide (TPR) repeat protein
MLAGDSLRDLGNLAYTQEGVDRALELWRESLACHEALGDTVGVARSLGNIGAGMYAAGLSDSAGVYYRRSQQLALEAGDFSAAANALTMLATLRKEEGDLSEAAVLYRRALETHERIGALRSVAADRHNLGLVALEMGDFHTARGELLAALEVSRRLGRMEDEGDHLSSLADVALAQGRYGEAQDLLQEALVLSRDAENQAGVAGIRHSLGILAMARGDFRLAIAELETARDLYTGLGYAANGISVRSDLARALAATGELRQGLSEMRGAVSDAEVSGMDPGVIADLELARGEMNLLLNDYGPADDRLRRAEALFRTLDDVAGLAAAQRGQALVHLYQGDPPRALSLLERALRTQQAQESPGPAAHTRLLMAAAEAEAGDSATARHFLGDALDVFRALEDPVGEAAALDMLGDMEVAAGLWASSDSLYSRGLRRLEGLDVPEISWRLHAGKGRAFDLQGATDSAAVAYRRAIEDIERVVETWPGSETLAGYLADKWQVYEWMAVAEKRLGNEGEAFRVSEKLRAQRVLHLLHRGRVQAPPSSEALASREQDLRQRIARLSALSTGGEWGQSSLRGIGPELPSLSDVPSALREARRGYAMLLDEIRDAGIPHGGVVVPEPAGWESVSEKLRPEDLFVEYLLTDSAGLAFVVSESELEIVELDSPREVVDDLVGFLRGIMGSRWDAVETELWRSALQRLYGILMEPLARGGWLEGRDHLYIVPHGTLHYLPFSALIGPDGGFLVERHAVSYAPSASVWIGLGDDSGGQGASPRILALAPRIEDLPGTLAEVRGIRDVWPDPVLVRTGPEATEELFQERGPDFAILHLATYGVANRTNPLFSHLDLYPTRSHDGRLEVHEIFRIPFRADLVVLSACETAVSAGSRADVPPGDDWVGFVRAFLAAGARNVLGTLWRVEDRATADLMTEFYGALAQGSGLAEALAEAQRTLISTPETSSPFFWSGFALVGEGTKRD